MLDDLLAGHFSFVAIFIQQQTRSKIWREHSLLVKTKNLKRVIGSEHALNVCFFTKSIRECIPSPLGNCRQAVVIPQIKHPESSIRQECVGKGDQHLIGDYSVIVSKSVPPNYTLGFVIL